MYVGAGAAPDADLQNGSVYAFDGTSGKLTWRRLLEGTVIAPTTVSGGMVFASSTRGLDILDAASGDSLWQEYSRGPVYSQPVVNDGTLYVTYVKGEVVAWRPAQQDGTTLPSVPMVRPRTE
jgi:outer membrane protein assembly factor BamB